MRYLLALVLSTAAWGCRESAPPPALPGLAPGEVPKTLEPAVTRADEAVRALRNELGSRLSQELARGGPPLAVAVCRDEAQAIAGRVNQARGVEVGRSALRLRNAANAPKPWVETYLRVASAMPPPELDSRVIDLGDRVGLVVPIRLAKPCLACHGPEASLDPAVKQTLKQSYPADQATGFAAGDLRGVFWAEVAKPGSPPGR